MGTTEGKHSFSTTGTGQKQKKAAPGAAHGLSNGLWQALICPKRGAKPQNAISTRSVTVSKTGARQQSPLTTRFRFLPFVQRRPSHQKLCDGLLRQAFQSSEGSAPGLSVRILHPRPRLLQRSAASINRHQVRFPGALSSILGRAAMVDNLFTIVSSVH